MELKSKLGEFATAKMFIIFLWQGAILTLLTAPLAVAVLDQQSSIGFLQVLAILLWVSALVGETIADQQLAAFSHNPANKGRTCQVGLWRYSRHPNYFFEWLGAVSFALYVSNSPYGLCTWICPIILFYLLMSVTGIKPSEEHSLKTRSDYADYMKRTSVFVPWRRT